MTYACVELRVYVRMVELIKQEGRGTEAALMP